MKVLFLDIDGVLNSNEYVKTDRYLKKEQGVGFPDCDLDENAIKRVNHICEKTGAKIVISSTWREMNDCIPSLIRNGLKIKVIGLTPCLDRKTESGVWMAKTRGQEIQAWLDKNEVDEYVILDDDKDMLDSQLSNFINTNYLYGLTEEDVEEAIKILGAN